MLIKLETNYFKLNMLNCYTGMVNLIVTKI